MRLTVKAKELQPGDKLTIYAPGSGRAFGETPRNLGEWEVMDEPPYHGAGLVSVPLKDGGMAVEERPVIYWRCKQLIAKAPAPGIALAELAEWKGFLPDHFVAVERPAPAEQARTA